jgi:hypothetical protein
MGHFVKGEIQRAKGRNVEVAVTAYEAAIALNPSLAPAYGALGGAKIRVGRSAEAFAPSAPVIRFSTLGISTSATHTRISGNLSQPLTAVASLSR